MKKKKIMSGTALLMAAALTLQSVDWSTLDVFAKDENFADTKVLQLSFENNVDDESDYIGNLSSYDLSNVDVTDAYLTNAEDKDIEYLLSLSSDRLLAGFRETAGLSMNGATRYDGWENTLIGGHTMGHYLTAMAQAVATLPDTDERKAQLQTKLNGIIDGLAECQDALGTGYIFGATLVDKNNVEKQFDNVEKGLTNITTQAWVPWYTMHKILAGLIDTYKYTGNEKALEVAEGLGDWVYNRTSKWDAATQTRVLNIEYGGMNDCLYELYAVTNNDKYAVAAHKFDQDSLFEAVNAGSANVLNGKHANTTIPKFLGALNRYVTTNGKTINGEVVDSTKYLEYAENFFDMVIENHTYITGDNSEWEHFGEDNILDKERTNCNCETCNAYNMLKLAKALYMITGNSKYSDYYENAFYNTILSSQNPDTGMTTYFQPMASGYFKVYGSETGNFWCCTGSGMENFTKLGNAIYFKTSDMVIVSQYFSSVLTDGVKNLKITQIADIPNSDTVSFTVNTLDGTENISSKVAFRLPKWLAADATVLVNGQAVSVAKESGYAIVEGLKNNDVITVKLPMEMKAYNLPDGESVYAFKYGPVVLSAKLGSTDMKTTTTGVNVSIPASKLIEEKYISDGTETVSVTNGTVADFMKNINDNLVKTEGKLEWTLENTDANLTFVPHYSQHTERYGIYFNYISNTGAINATKYIQDKATDRFNQALLDTVQPAYGQYEDDELHEMQESGNGSVGNVSETTRYAKAGGAFVYTMKAAKGEDNCLQLTFKKADNGKTIKISVGNKVVYEKTLDYDGANEEYTVRIPVSAEDIDSAVYEKTVSEGTFNVVDVKFESADENDSARVCVFVYNTKAYSTDTSLNLVPSVGTAVQDGTTFTVSVPKDASSVDLSATLANRYGYLRINGSVVKETVPYTVDMSNKNFVTLTYTVYAEDHETNTTYTVKMVKDADLANRENVDKSLAYFVNCGDYDVTTLSEGDLFGIYNGVTDQAYGTDPVTGYQWGVADTVSTPLKNGTATNIAAMTNAVFTDNTWPCETNASADDTSAKTATNRYTKNQYESGIDRNLNYDFELPNGEYTVALYFADPWGCSKNPTVSAEGEKVLENVSVNKEVTAKVDVTDGKLSLNITSDDKAINLAYIKIYNPDVEIIDNNDQNNSGSNGNLTDDNKNENGKNEVADGKVGTGDHSNIILYVVLMGIAAAVLAEMAIVTIRKRKAIKR
ncbi:MAG: glycoside hydrolase family 127 protein [Lachnospiraceae bacterium]|nr:glycoside hydrolase family 127 protein [Lachnospiraceae bacterium]